MHYAFNYMLKEVLLQGLKSDFGLMFDKKIHS